MTLANGQNLDDLCTEYIPEYNKDRLEAFAIRVFLGYEMIITIFAVDKIRQENSGSKEYKLPVKKFKLTNVPLTALFNYCSAFNCTLHTGNYNLEDIEVMNK